MANHALLILASLTALAACGDPQPSTRGSTSPVPPADAFSADAAALSVNQVYLANAERPSLTATPQPVGRFVEKGEILQFGGLTVKITSKDGMPFCEFDRRLRYEKRESDGITMEHSTNVGGGFDIIDDPDAPCFVYVHTTHEIWAFGGRGFLSRSDFRLLPDGTFGAETSRLTADTGAWTAPASLLETMPDALIDRIQEFLQRR